MSGSRLPPLRRRHPRSERKFNYSRFNNIRQLFATAFDIAVYGLDAVDIARLHVTDVGRLGDLNWMEASALDRLSRHLDVLAHRELRHRFKLLSLEREALVKELGGRRAFEDGHRMFILAALIDQHFGWPSQEDEETVAPQRLKESVIAPPQRFFGEIENPPPPIGQMMPVAAR